MPWQAQLYVGEPVHSFVEIRDVWRRLGKKRLPRDEEDLFDLTLGLTIRHAGKLHRVAISARHETEGGTTFPTEPPGASYCDAIVGFALTERYDGAVLDADCENGRPEPFVFDPRDCERILKQVRRWWPQAKLMIWDNWY